VASALAVAGPAGAGHEMPFYPSFYPQRIAVEALRAPVALERLRQATLHAHVGDLALAVRGGSPRARNAHLSLVESLAGYLVVTMNPASPRLSDPERRCAAAARLAGALAPDGWTRHPYPVTPYHPDFFRHADLAAAAATRVRAPAGPGAALDLAVRTRGALAARVVPATARRGSPGAWDVLLEEVPLEIAAGGAPIPLNGWSGPAALKDGWSHARVLLASAIAEPSRAQAVTGLGQRLARGEPARLAERIEAERALVRTLVAGCERVVLGYTLRREPLNGEYSAGVENAASDAQAGLASGIFARTVKLKDFPWNGELEVGVPAASTAAWNPVAGFTDPTGALLWRALGDPALLPAPHGEGWIDNRVRVEGAAPDEPRPPIGVPPDAIIFAPGTGLPRAVGPGRTAQARVTYRVLTSAFHDGSRTGVADLLYALAFAFRWGGASGPDRDAEVERATAGLRESLVGLRVLRVDTDVLRFGEVVMQYEVPVVEVYLAGGGAARAALAAPWSTVPWPALAAMEEAVRRGVGAFSAEEARRRGVPWLDVVRDPRARAALLRVVEELRARRAVPPALEGRVTGPEAEKRWEALARFARERQHLLVTNGPYRLERATRRRVELGVFRDFSYPLGVGSFNRFSIPVRAFPTRVEVKGAEIEVHADLERVERFGREHTVSRGPLAADWATRDAAAVPECHWLALGADDAVVGAGVASLTPAGTFGVRLPERSRVRQVLVALPVNGHWTQVEVRSVRVE